MLKAKKFDVKDSNLALFGSDLERNVKEASAASEEAWQGSGEEVGVEIWRIVKFKVVPWPKDQYGEFYMGDSYIVLNTYKEEESDELNYDLHFWIGKFSTQDEYGTAAYKTVELDTFHKDKPVQHREVQGYETELFKSYFKTMEYLAGGADTGFRHVLPDAYTKRLLRLRGDRKHVAVTEIPLKKKYVTSNDVLILDVGRELIQRNGADANMHEKRAAMQFLMELKGKRSHEAMESAVCDEGDDEEFWDKFGDQGDDDDDDYEDYEEPLKAGPKLLFRVNDESGFDEVAKGDEINKTLFLAADVFILDVKNACYVWIGEDASDSEKKQAMGHASNHLNKTDYPWAPISVIKQGRENDAFNALVAAC